MFCKYCGAELPEKAQFCFKCGKETEYATKTSDPKQAGQHKTSKRVPIRQGVCRASIILGFLGIICIVIAAFRGGANGGPAFAILSIVFGAIAIGLSLRYIIGNTLRTKGILPELKISGLVLGIISFAGSILLLWLYYH